MYRKTVKFLHVLCRHLELVKVTVDELCLPLRPYMVIGVLVNSNFGFQPMISLASCIAVRL